MRRSVAKFFYAVFSRKSPATASSPMVSRRQRRGLLPLHRAPVLDLQQRQVPKLSLQLSHGGAASSKDGSRVIINDRRVWTRMVAITLRFTVCSCLYRETECHFGSAKGDPREAVSAKDPSENRPLRRMRRPIARAAPPPAGLSAAAAPSRGQPLARRRPPDAKGSTSRRPTDHPLAIERRAARSRLASPAAPPNKEGSLAPTAP